MKHLLLACISAISFFLMPISTFASTADLSSNVTDLTKLFSEKFCTSISSGLTAEKAGETAAVQLSKGLLFSPVMSEIMSSSKEAIAISLSKNIWDGCGNNLEGTKEELDNYLDQLTKKIPIKSTSSFQLAPIRQQPSN